jgi:hypothetical protein
MRKEGKGDFASKSGSRFPSAHSVYQNWARACMGVREACGICKYAVPPFELYVSTKMLLPKTCALQFLYFGRCSFWRVSETRRTKRARRVKR